MWNVRKIKKYEINSLLYYLKWSLMGMLKKLTVRRFINILHVLYEWKTKKPVARSRPFVFRLEPSAVCNIKCPACPTPKKVFPMGAVKQMSFQTFETIYKSIYKSAFRMTFYMLGEPMTNPRLFDM